MALIKCPECDKEVSDKAHFCPNCGNPIEINRSEERQDASLLLAEKTQESAELLAATTKKAAQKLSESKEISAKWMRLMTIVLVTVGFIQIVIATTALFISLRVK